MAAKHKGYKVLKLVKSESADKYVSITGSDVLFNHEEPRRTEEEKIDRDKLLYGESFSIGGRHVSFERITKE